MQFNEILKEMRSTFRKADSQALRPLDTFNMLPLFDYLKFKETITKQRNQIEDLACRYGVFLFIASKHLFCWQFSYWTLQVEQF